MNNSHVTAQGNAPVVAPLKKGEAIEILPEWQDKGDAERQWFVYEDEYDGRLGIFTPLPQMAFQPWQTVSAYMVRRVEKPGFLP